MKENLKTFLSFIVFSAFIVLIGWLIGAYQNDITTEGYTEITIHKPAGEGRF